MVRLLTALLCITVLIGCTQNQKLPDPLEAGWKGEKVCEMIHEDDDIRVLKCTFPPQIGHELHYHQPHFGYTLVGGTFQITDESGTRTLEVKTGSNFRNTEIISHEVLNVGTTTAVFLITEIK